jgi:hypothetical protein
VAKPAEVSQDDWDKLVKSAARELVAAYKQMEEVAPDAVYELAGMAKPERAVERSLSLNAAIMSAIDQLGMDVYIIDVYLVGAQVVVLMNQGGKLYTVPISEADDGTVTLGTPTEIAITAQSNKVNITRQADGQYRWFALAACSVVNKSGEIDSRALFDDFVNRFNAGQGFVLRFFHDRRMEPGVGDYLARCENVLIASGLVHDTDLGRALIDASIKQRGNWGTSPGFYPDAEPEILRTDDGIEVPVYTHGYLEEISVLPEDCACNFFTRLIANVKERAMDTRTREALITLFGDEAQADEFIKKVDETNRAITDGGLLTRETTTEQTETITTEQPTETLAETVTIPGELVELQGEDVLSVARQAFRTMVDEWTEANRTQWQGRFEALETQNETLSNALAELKQAVDALKLTDAQKQAIWQADRPADSARLPVTYRPRTDRRSGEEGSKPSFADIAAGTLATIPKK